MENPKICKAVRLNPDSTDLKCEDFDVFKKCIVPKSHFDKVGYYYKRSERTCSICEAGYYCPGENSKYNCQKGTSVVQGCFLFLCVCSCNRQPSPLYAIAATLRCRTSGRK